MNPQKKTPADRGLRAALAVTGALERRPTVRRLLVGAGWLTALGLAAGGCMDCTPAWGPTAPPRGPEGAA